MSNLPMCSEVPSSGQKKKTYQPMNVQDLWSSVLGEKSNDDGVYFYGTPGTFKVEEVKPNPASAPAQSQSVWSSKSFKEVLGSDGQPVNMYYEAPDPRPVCTFFQAGNCKFGHRCRFKHILDEEAARSFRGQCGEPKECGICIEPLPSAMYGLLSHCECKFCLDCIRNWRRDGVAVTKESEAVRLCPLCRQESHFIVPSVQFVRQGPEKDMIVETYKQSLQRIPCKNLTKGECKFGSSCFYYHDPELERALRRPTLGDYLSPRLQQSGPR